MNTALGVFSVVIGLVSFVPYFKDMYAAKTRPHPFSWFIWAFLDSSVFVVQVIRGGGAGAWATGITALFTFVIAVLSLRHGDKQITKFDWACFIGGLFGVALWALTSDPLYAVIIATIVNLVAMGPTVRKSYYRPHEETLSLYVLSTVKWTASLLALESMTITTMLFPVSLVLINIPYIMMLVVRRNQLAFAREVRSV
jgi:hypothetical protein